MSRKLKFCIIALLVTTTFTLTSCSSNKHNYITIVSDAPDAYQMMSI